MFGEGIMYGLLFFALYFEVFLLLTFLQKRFTRIQSAHIEDADLIGRAHV